MTEIDFAVKILAGKGEPIHYKELLTEAIKQAAPDFSADQAELQKKVAQLYTELTLDSRFTALGKGMWGLVKWTSAAKSLKSDEEEGTEGKRKMFVKRGKALATYEADEDEDFDLDEDFEEEEELPYDDEELLPEDEEFDDLPLEDEDLGDLDEEIVEEEDWD